MCDSIYAVLPFAELQDAAVWSWSLSRLAEGDRKLLTCAVLSTAFVMECILNLCGIIFSFEDA